MFVVETGVNAALLPLKVCDLLVARQRPFACSLFSRDGSALAVFPGVKNGCTNQVDAPAKRSYFIFIKGKLFALLTTGTAFAICRFATGTTGTFFPTFGLFFEHAV